MVHTRPGSARAAGRRVGSAALLAAALTSGAAPAAPDPRQDPGLVDILSRAPAVQVTMRYASTDNFLGVKVDGYEANRCLLSPPAAEALAQVQAELMPFGLGLRLYDCYRPQRAVDHFMRWSKDPADQKTRLRYYPNEDKARLFERGYVDARSGHSRGSTVDLGIVDAAGEELDMGTGWDFLDPRSATEYADIPEAARRNRLLLRAVMEKHGFGNYEKEWWHFTLREEPWPGSYLDVPVR